MPSRQPVRIVEVGPRDGLQNISKIVSTKVKIELIKRLMSCGHSTVEITSFVSPKWIPQLADGKRVIDGVRYLFDDSSLRLPVLVPNTKGMELALESGVKEIAVFISASEGFSLKNTNCSVDVALSKARDVAIQARNSGISVRGYISCIFACPFDGPTPPEAVLRVARALLEMGCYEISLGDTLGVGTTADVENLLSVLFTSISPTQLAGHFHDTYGQAVANVLKSYDLGLRVFDSSVAGLGGCPYAPGAKGNVATEDIVYVFSKLHIPTGINLEKLVDVGQWISQQLGIDNNSRAGAALFSKKKSSSPSISTPKAPVARQWSNIHSTEDFNTCRHNSDVKITLTQPKRGNVLTEKILKDLTGTIRDLARDKTVFRIIIAGTGKYFCTGMDLGSDGSATSTKAEAKEQQMNALQDLFESIDTSPQVTIAFINGPAFGGGIGLAFSCDIRLATKTASFTLSETKLGLAPAVISKYVLREWGRAVAREAMLTAREVRSTELCRLGIVHAVAKDTVELNGVLEDYLDRLNRCAPQASAICKQLCRISDEEQTDKIKSSFAEMMGSDEAKYGIEKFRQGINPVVWQGLYAKHVSKL